MNLSTIRASYFAGSPNEWAFSANEVLGAQMAIVYTRHAQEAFRIRSLSAASIEAILLAPVWIEPDPRRADVQRAFGTAPETGARWVRVAFRVLSNGDILVVTFHPDRDAIPPGP